MNNWFNSEILFPIPFWSGLLEKVDEKIIKESARYCLEFSKQQPGRVISNRGGFQSNNLFFQDLIQTPLQSILFNLQKKIELIEDDLQIIKNSLKIGNLWFNVNYKECYNEKHNHPYSDFSGVFYLTDNNSDIIFYRSDPLCSYWLDTIDSFKINPNTSNSYKIHTASAMRVKPKKLELFIFPAWLEHSVESNNSDKPRISVAFNLKLNHNDPI